jgi:hypothetical protein
MVIGHGTLLPAYVSVIYYAANPNKRMPAGWVVPNVITSLMAGSLGGLMIELSTYPSPSGDGQLAGPAAVSVVAGSVFVIVRLG